MKLGKKIKTVVFGVINKGCSTNVYLCWNIKQCELIFAISHRYIYIDKINILKQCFLS